MKYEAKLLRLERYSIHMTVLNNKIKIYSKVKEFLQILSAIGNTRDLQGSVE